MTTTFTFTSEQQDCGILIYDKGTRELIKKIPFSKKECIGNVYTKVVKGLDRAKICYRFYEGEKPLADCKGKGFLDCKEYGVTREQDELYAYFPEQEYFWGKDKKPKYASGESIAYCIHVRGFSKHASSGVKHKGTFKGIAEKLPYLRELGVTTLELQPIYEFAELKPDVKSRNTKLNYWGYTEGMYYAPKAAYCAGDEPGEEFSSFVKSMHENGIEVILQFYFEPHTSVFEIADILLFWTQTYHVDGFHLIGENLPVDMLLQNVYLKGTKIWYHAYQDSYLYEKDDQRVSLYRDEYMFTLRRFLKGDEGVLVDTLEKMRQSSKSIGSIKYFSNYYGFTLKDCVSYDRKHNEDNGEDNRDGMDYTCSWNCGEEGESRKKKITALRLQQMKNALCMLFFSAGTPLLFMGDEFGNSQRGNNNPYCQDNEVTWLNWRDEKRNQELFQFCRMLIQLRKDNKILHPTSEPRLMDYKAYGYPDVSYHGETPWQPRLYVYQRHIGILYCGYYGGEEKKDAPFFYLGINMYWEPCKLALPRLPKGLCWRLLEKTTSGNNTDIEDENGKTDCFMEPRSISIYISEQERG